MTVQEISDRIKRVFKTVNELSDRNNPPVDTEPPVLDTELASNLSFTQKPTGVFFPKLNQLFSGYFDPIDITLDNKNK